MESHSHRLSDPAVAVAAEATVDPAQAGMLCEHSARSNIESVGGSSKTGPEELEPQGTRGKDKLSDKYLAGLLDSDGCITMIWRQPGDPKYFDKVNPPDVQRAYAMVSFCQKTADQSFMRLIANSLTPPSLDHTWGAVMTTAKDGTHYWQTNGTKAVSVLMRLKKYLVIKRALAECAIDMNGKLMNVEEGRQRFDATHGASLMPKHPTRKWVAGYLDGDGSFKAFVQHRGVAASLLLCVSSEVRHRVGVDLLQKAYGGSIQDSVSSSGGQIVTWVLHMDAAKVRSLFESGKGGIAKHMALKTDQVYFLLGCAKMGHFRDGERIKAGLEQLRVQPHRLSGPGADVARLLETVRDVPLFMGPEARQRRRQWELANANTTDYEGEIVTVS